MRFPLCGKRVTRWAKSDDQSGPIQNSEITDPENFEQTEIPRAIIGVQARFLEAGMRLAVEFVAGRPINILFPDVLEVKIADTAPPSHQQQDTNFKPATLDNGVEVMVPQFVKTGDTIRLDIENLRYMDRAKARRT
jgi:elongation factor P